MTTMNSSKWKKGQQSAGGNIAFHDPAALAKFSCDSVS